MHVHVHMHVHMHVHVHAPDDAREASTISRHLPVVCHAHAASEARTHARVRNACVGVCTCMRARMHACAHMHARTCTQVALSKLMGKPLPYEALSGVRARMSAIAPQLGERICIHASMHMHERAAAR